MRQEPTELSKPPFELKKSPGCSSPGLWGKAEPLAHEGQKEMALDVLLLTLWPAD